MLQRNVIKIATLCEIYNFPHRINYVSHMATKADFKISDQVRHRHTEKIARGLKFRISESRVIVLCCVSCVATVQRFAPLFSHMQKSGFLMTWLRCCFLAHLSRRLTGELIGYPWIRRPSVRPSSASVVRPFTFSNIFSSETAWPIKAKFYVEPPWEGRTKVYINGQGHMTKMAAKPIYGKNPSKIFS